LKGLQKVLEDFVAPYKMNFWKVPAGFFLESLSHSLGEVKEVVTIILSTG